MEQNTPADDKNPTVLSYGKGRSPFSLKWIFIPLLAIVLIVGCWKVQPWIFGWIAQRRLLRVQDRLSHQLLPSGTVIYSDDPVQVAALRGRPGYALARFRTDVLPDPPSSDPSNFHVHRFSDSKFSYTPVGIEWVSTAHIFQGCNLWDAFSCERTSVGGIKWLTSIGPIRADFYADGEHSATFYPSHTVQPVGWRPGSFGVPGWLLPIPPHLYCTIALRKGQTLTVFALQPDPSDASTIIIPYQIDRVPGVLKFTVDNRGWLHLSVVSGWARLTKL